MTRTRTKPNKTDVLAAVLFGFMFLFFIVFLRHGLNAAFSDESYYFAMPYRFLQGDRMLVDEWYLTQFNSVLLMPVLKLFLALRGSADGLLLFFRCLFLLFLSAIYWILYKETRALGLHAAVTVFLFCLTVPFTVFSFSYYSVALYLYAVVCAVLFVRQKRLSAPTLILLGAVFSFAVFSEPGLLLAWLVLAALTAVGAVCHRQGKAFLPQYAVFLNFRTLGLTAAGGAVCGGGMLAYLAVKSGVSAILRVLPSLLSDPEHISPLSKLMKHILPFKTFGAVPYGVCVFFVLAAAVYRLLPRRSRAIKTVLFAGICVGVSLCMAVMLTESVHGGAEGLFTFLLLYPYLFNVLGLAVFFLCEGKDPRTTPFLFAGLCLGFAADLFSEATFGFGGTLVLFYLTDAVPRFLRELRATSGPVGERSPARRETFTRAVSLAAAVLLTVSSALWQARYCMGFASAQYERKAAEITGSADDAKADTKLERGPLRGLYTSAYLRRNYDAVLADLDVIGATCSGTLYIPDLSPYMYLSSPLRCGTLSVFFEGDYVYERQREYWQLLPEKRPDVIYVPNDRFTQQIPADKLGFLRNICTYETQRLSAGVLLRVTEWKN